MSASEQIKITDAITPLPSSINEEHILVPLFWHWYCMAFQDMLFLTCSTFTYFQKTQKFGTLFIYASTFFEGEGESR